MNDPTHDHPRRPTPSATDVSHREREVLGDGPRIGPLQVDELTADVAVIVERMIAVNEAINARRKTELYGLQSDDATLRAERLAGMSEIMRTMLRHTDLFARQTEIGIQLLGKGALAPRDRELAVLRIGWLCQAPYEWGEHVHVARSVGITRDEVERVTQGSAAPGWNAHEAAILRAVEELYGNAMISDATWATLAETLDDKQLIELPIVIGQYQTVAYYQNSLRLRLHEGNAGLKAR
ncbi:MAG: carboxymuconolactone decarboxylase family protein [Solimonas sp.]